MNITMDGAAHKPAIKFALWMSVITVFLGLAASGIFIMSERFGTNYPEYYYTVSDYNDTVKQYQGFLTQDTNAYDALFKSFCAYKGGQAHVGSGDIRTTNKDICYTGQVIMGGP